MCKIGFTRCTSEYGVYTRGVGAARVVVGVYVDISHHHWSQLGEH
jgi:hypothetical protein